MNILYIVIAAVALVVVLLLIFEWGRRTHNDIGILAGFCLVWGIPIVLFLVLFIYVQVYVELSLGAWIVLSLVLGVLAFLRDPGAALVGGLFGLAAGLIYLFGFWIFGHEITFENAGWYVGRFVIGGWVTLALYSWIAPTRGKTKP